MDTCYSLYLRGPWDEMASVKEEIKKLGTGQAALVTGSYACMDEWGWEPDLKKIALAHPDVLICLSGIQPFMENPWEARFKGNDYEYCKFDLTFKNPKLSI